MNNPSVQQLTQAGAPRGLIDAQLATLTGADAQFAQLKEQLHSVLTWNLAAFGVTVIVAVVAGILLYRRQRRRRTACDLHIAQTVNRAAQLTP